MDEQEIQRLEAELEAAETAVRDHRRTGISIFRDPTAPREPTVVINAAWLDEQRRLREKARAAYDALLDYFERHARR